MDAIEFFRLRYDNVHPRVWERTVRGLSEHQLRSRPHPAVNTIVWQIWHLARCEDVGVNRLVADRAQVLDDEGWPVRLGVERRDIGTGMTDAEVDVLSANVDLDALRAYWAAISERTLAVVATLPSDILAAPLDADRLHAMVVEERMLGEHAGWVEPMWARQACRAWFLAQLALTHNTGHLYQIAMLRGLWGQPGA
jgi:hypothetical protein